MYDWSTEVKNLQLRSFPVAIKHKTCNPGQPEQCVILQSISLLPRPRDETLLRNTLGVLFLYYRRKLEQKAWNLNSCFNESCQLIYFKVVFVLTLTIERCNWQFKIWVREHLFWVQKDEKYFILGGNFTLHILHLSSNRHQQLISSATELSMTTKNTFSRMTKKIK